jgi:SAM-dependent methyltransferase
VAQFDRYGDAYTSAVEKSIAFSGRDVDFFTALKAERLVGLARRHVGEPSTIAALDVGCGLGLTDAHLVQRFGQVTGLDVSAEMIERAEARNPSVDYLLYDGGRFPFEDGSFDLTFAICVLHHVPPATQPALLAEMSRVTRPGGLVAVIEHNPWNPLTRLVVARCEFDDEAILLTVRDARELLERAGLSEQEWAYFVFFPFRTRAELPLRRLPLGAQYYVASSR